MLTIAERARRCDHAVANYSDDDAYTCILDIIADAMHWCRLNGRDFESLLNMARDHFEAETLEETGELP
jgi:hypothetical protein